MVPASPPARAAEDTQERRQMLVHHFANDVYVDLLVVVRENLAHFLDSPPVHLGAGRQSPRGH